MSLLLKRLHHLLQTNRVPAHHQVVDPPLPPALQQTLRAVPTWMSHAMKSVAVYAEPFRRTRGWSGFASAK